MAVPQSRSRFWWWYFGIFIFLIGSSFVYSLWREHTLEPVVASINLKRPGVLRRSVRFLRVHPSRYHPGFHIALAVPTDEDWWSEGDQSAKIWAVDPPDVEIVVRDSDGEIILRERGPVSEANGWVVTGGGRPGETEVAIYKLTEFTGSPFERYDVVVRVVKNTSSRTVRSAHFYISAIKSYALLPNSIVTFLLVAVFAVSTPIVLIVRHLRHRRHRAPAAGA